MTNRRADVVYFAFIVVVAGVAYLVADGPSDEGPVPEVPILELPELVIEPPFEFPYRVAEFEPRAVPRLELSRDIESALGEIRLALLQSSKVVAVQSSEQLAAVMD